ncbi:hypothetical protein [Tropicimonas aquimaris]|uniref:Uncharacterized protein n=1 Tax=Tropicimonas aquimaris TaxID=914152 RepID=A0ABW3IWW7_9RHOB
MHHKEQFPEGTPKADAVNDMFLLYGEFLASMLDISKKYEDLEKRFHRELIRNDVDIERVRTEISSLIDERAEAAKAWADVWSS